MAASQIHSGHFTLLGTFFELCDHTHDSIKHMLKWYERIGGWSLNLNISVIFFRLFFLCFIPRLGPVFHKDVGGGQPRPSGGGAESAGSAHRRKLGPQRQQENVALREQPLPHHHRQIRPVPSLVLPGVPAGQYGRTEPGVGLSPKPC